MIRLSLFFVSLLFWYSLATTPLQNLQVTLRGKNYDINDVSTVKELKSKMKKVSGNTKEHHVLFGGKRLSSSTVLAEAGVEDGAQLNMVPVLSNNNKVAKENSRSSLTTDNSEGVRTTTVTESRDETTNAVKSFLEKSGVDSSKMEELMNQMGSGATSNGKAPDVNETFEMMQNMMSNPMFQQYMSDPKMIEQSRQMILNNPMLKNMMAGMPGMAEIIEDPVAWREAMQAAVSLYKNMDPEQLKSMLNGSLPPGGMGSGMGGVFDNYENKADGLDELDEE